MAQTTLVIAHRGASRAAPENTVPAIEQAVENGVDLIALDVQGSKDHVPLVIADSKLERTTNGAGKVGQLTAKEIQALDAGSWFNAKFKGTAVPTLAEALKAAGKKSRVLLNLPDLRSSPDLAKAIAKDLKGAGNPAESLLAFTDSESLKGFREQAPDFGYLLVLGEKIEGWVMVEKARALGLKAIRPFRSQVTSDLVRAAHAKNQQVFAHFADEESEMRDLIAMHVDGIVTGRPERLKEVLKETKA
ncbi:MAG: hypothetical protein KIS92_07890 [Planctomycetota bacterium]|nr:hypothetical protein [Planctomycetota bacterium]